MGRRLRCTSENSIRSAECRRIGTDLPLHPVAHDQNVSYAFGPKLAATMYVQGTFPSLTQHESQVTTNYTTVAGAGERTADNALPYPTHPDFMMPMYTSSDNFHPNGADHQQQNSAIPLKALPGQ